uniref:Uncharacterized protein n=1 Tax=Electrophorus electricus TaxID=8005 RepID=A0A4W4FLA7_ELEEL
MYTVQLRVKDCSYYCSFVRAMPHLPLTVLVSPQQSFFVMSMFAIALLTPAGWILHHIPEYRTRRQPPPT